MRTAKTICLSAILAHCLIAADPSMKSASQRQDDPCSLNVDWSNDTDIAALPRDIGAYSVYVIYAPSSESAIACDGSAFYLDASRASRDDSRRQQICAATRSSLPPITRISSPTCSAERRITAAFKSIVLPLLTPLSSNRHYVITVQLGAPVSKTVELAVTPAASIITPDPTRIADEIKVLSTVTLNAPSGSSVMVTRSTSQDGTPATQTFAGRVIDVLPDGIVIHLSTSLPGGKSSKVSVSLPDMYGTAVKAEGTVQRAAAPKNASDAFISTKSTFEAAVHQKPVFTLSGAVAPLHPSGNAVYCAAWIFNCGFFARGVSAQRPLRLDPSVTYDVGFNSTQSANSITVPSMFSLPIYVGTGKADLNAAGPADPVPVPPSGLSVVNFSFGPRAEFDRTWQRVNMLGEVRGEFYFLKFTQTQDVKKATIAQGNPAIRDLLELPNRGFSVAPYVQWDGGGHVTNETVTNNKTHVSVLVPTHAINRLYGGIYGNAQLGIISFMLDTSFVNLFSHETIGYTTSTDALLRHLNGLHPHTKFTTVVSIDPAKHYGLTLTYENGRSAPNFAYLNKFDAGVQIVY
jgi:hypothetical protein